MFGICQFDRKEGTYVQQLSEHRGHRRRDRRSRMRRRGYTEESVENIRSMMEEADPARREQLKRDLEELMREM